MAKQLFSNNASALLAASISDSDLTIQVQNGFGALYPSPGADEYFLVTLENDNGDIEVVKVTTRAVDLFTVPVGGRGQEGTSAQAWTNGQARVECRLTRGTLEVFVQRDGDEMTGDLNMNDNEIQEAILIDSRVQDSEVVNSPLRGNSGDSSNEIAVPDDGTRATAGGQRILTEDDESDVKALVYKIGMIMDWYGTAENCPEDWAICDGTGGTPDLRGFFIRGASTNDQIGDEGGAASATTSSNGAHTHTVTSGAHTLTEAEMPAHTHSIAAQLFIDEADNGTPIRYIVEGSGKVTGSTGGGQAHTHPDGTADSQGAHTHTVDTIPPFKYLYKIMYVGP